jgi:translation initiation factor 1
MSENRLVYSTDAGRICSACEKPQNQCVCADRAKQAVQGDGNVKLRRETKGRGGKTVVVITGLPLNQLEMSALVTALKKRCGSGGTIKDGAIEIQGEHLDTIRAELVKRGFKPKG